MAESHRRRDTTNGEWVDAEPTYWQVIVWGQQAEHATESLAEGHHVVVVVVVVGRTGTPVYTRGEGSRTGEPQRMLEVTADQVAPSLRWATATVTKAARSMAEPDVAGHYEAPF